LDESTEEADETETSDETEENDDEADEEDETEEDISKAEDANELKKGLKTATGDEKKKIVKKIIDLKKSVKSAPIQKAKPIVATLKVDKTSENLEKAISSVQNITSGGFKSIGVVLKGIYDLQKTQNEKIDSLQDDLQKSLDENAELKEMLEKGLDSIEELGDSAPARKSLSTAKARDKKFIDKKELNKGLNEEDEFEKSEDNGKLNLSVSKHKNVILSKMDGLTFLEKGLDDEMASAMTLFESSGQLTKGALVKLNKAGINITK